MVVVANIQHAGCDAMLHHLQNDLQAWVSDEWKRDLTAL